MAQYDEQILEQNPWWRDPDAVSRDAHLDRLAKARFQWNPPALAAVPLIPGSTHTLRGPRQVGKTTTVKKFVERLVRQGETRVLYYSFDLQKQSRAIRDVVTRAKKLHPDPDGPWYVFLDEVTSIPDWQMGIKYLWDHGTTRDDLVLCTGSSARKMGAEQLPGRRGDGRDFVHLPLSFRAFCRDALRLDLPDETIEVADMVSAGGHRILRQYNLRAGELDDAVARFLEVGGFPAAVQDALGGRTVSNASEGPGPGVNPGSAGALPGTVGESTVRMLWDIIAGDIQEAGRDKHSALKLLERVGVSLGATVAWDSLRKDMDVGSHTTAKEYTHMLSEAFMLLTVFYWTVGGGFEPERQRKLYFIDPLIARIAPTLTPGARRANADGLLENLVAVALYRSAAESLVLADPLPGGIGYWRSSDQRETDFVVPSSATAETRNRFPVEVKGDAARGISAARLSIKRTFGRGVVVTRTVFDWQDDVPAVPLGIFLAALGDRPQRAAAAL